MCACVCVYACADGCVCASLIRLERGDPKLTLLRCLQQGLEMGVHPVVVVWWGTVSDGTQRVHRGTWGAPASRRGASGETWGTEP